MYQTARELFEAAREAALDAERARGQIEGMEERAASISAPTFEAHVSTGGGRDRISSAVASMLDARGRLEKRIEADYEIIDAANRVLYGRDGVHGGLSAIVPAWWADLLWWHYLACETWGAAAEAVGTSERNAHYVALAALEAADANGMMWTVIGRGMAEA